MTKPTKKPAAKVTTVDEYVAAAPKDKRAAVTQLRKTIKAAAPKATERLSYGLVGYKQDGKPLVGLGYWKAHIALYGSTGRLVKEFPAELKPYVKSKGTIQFPADQPIPYALVAKVVKARLAEIERKG